MAKLVYATKNPTNSQIAKINAAKRLLLILNRIDNVVECFKAVGDVMENLIPCYPLVPVPLLASLTPKSVHATIWAKLHRPLEHEPDITEQEFVEVTPMLLDEFVTGHIYMSERIEAFTLRECLDKY